MFYYILSEESDESCNLGVFDNKDLALKAAGKYMNRLECLAVMSDLCFTVKDCFSSEIETDDSWVWHSDYFDKYVYVDRVPANTLMV